MKYNRFEELPVWQAGIDLAAEIYAMTAKPEFKNRYSLRDKIERAGVSVSNNIAEGFERGTNQELLTFLYIARGSAGEVRSMLCLLQRIPGICDLESEISLLTPARSAAPGRVRRRRSGSRGVREAGPRSVAGARRGRRGGGG